MKKYIIITVVVVVAFILLLTLGKKDSTNNAKYGLVYTTMNTVDKKLNNKDDFVLVLSQDGCSHCEDYLPVVKEVADEYKIAIYDLNLTKLSQSDQNSLLTSFKNINSTPTTIFIKDGKEYDSTKRILISITKDELVKKLQKEGFIK